MNPELRTTEMLTSAVNTENGERSGVIAAQNSLYERLRPNNQVEIHGKEQSKGELRGSQRLSKETVDKDAPSVVSENTRHPWFTKKDYGEEWIAG